MMSIKSRPNRWLALLLAVLLCVAAAPACSLAEGELQAPVVSEPTVEVVSPSADSEATEAPEAVPSDIPTTVPTAAPTAVPIPTEIPVETESPYEVAVLTPIGWTNAAKATVTLSIVERAGLGVQQLEIALNDQWEDLTLDYASAVNGELELTITENATLYVRVTDPHSHQFTEESELQVFDRTPPTVNAGIVSANLQVQAQDTLSGVGGIQVNGLLFTTMQDGNLNIKIADVLSKYERLAVRAFDYAGNFSEPVTLDNPYYVAEPDPTTVPTVTPKPTQAPSSETGPVIATQAPTPIATSTPDVVYVYPDEPTATAEPIVETEYITIGPGMPYLADGNSHTLDVLYSAATNKQFITVQTKSGNTFFLVIDYDKPIDAESEMYETYFLNLVDERDLLALMDESEMPTATPRIVYVTPEPTTVPASTTVPVADTTPPKEDNKQMTAIIALAAILGIGGIGGFLFFKSKRGKSNAHSAPDYGFEDDDDEQDDEDTTN